MQWSLTPLPYKGCYKHWKWDRTTLFPRWTFASCQKKQPFNIEWDDVNKARACYSWQWQYTTDTPTHKSSKMLGLMTRGALLPLILVQDGNCSLCFTLNRFHLFSTARGRCTVPGGTAIPGRCVEWTEQAPVPSPCSKNQFNIWSPGRGRIRY